MSCDEMSYYTDISQFVSHNNSIPFHTALRSCYPLESFAPEWLITSIPKPNKNNLDKLTREKTTSAAQMPVIVNVHTISEAFAIKFKCWA